jgi:predicted AlkP superfamily phosphohydrolase/phosphomutase
MRPGNGARVLAIGIDAAEPAFVRCLIEQGEMPALKSLMERGSWKRVESTAHIGSGSVWPTFITGTEAREHGIYGEWGWQPETMSLSRYSGRRLTPFWKALAARGTRVGVLDVPFAPAIDLPDGFEISEWGAHDTLEGRTQINPETLSDFVSQTRPHPLQHKNIDAAGPDDYEQLAKVRSACLDGVKLRGELAGRLLLETEPRVSVVVFTEVHHAAHYFWHSLAPDHPFYAGDSFADAPPALGTPLQDIYREVDKQVGRLVEVAGSDAFVMVFSLHGMQPTLGIAAFLAPLMIETGWSHLSGWATQSWRERALSLFAAAKRHAPSGLKKLYYKTLPRNATLHLAQPTMLPTYDWSRTRAFSLPSDQHGWIRINLAGREAHGIVPPQEYEETRRRLREMITGLTTEDGKPLVRDCFSTSGSYEDALTQPLPDLIAHYEDAAFDPRMRIKGMKFAPEAIGRKFTGQHALEGFLIAAGQRGAIPDAPAVHAKDLHRMIINSLGESAGLSRGAGS